MDIKNAVGDYEHSGRKEGELLQELTKNFFSAQDLSNIPQGN